MGWFWLDVPLAVALFVIWAAACAWLVRACGRNHGPQRDVHGQSPAAGPLLGGRGQRQGVPQAPRAPIAATP